MRRLQMQWVIGWNNQLERKRNRSDETVDRAIKCVSSNCARSIRQPHKISKATKQNRLIHRIAQSVGAIGGVHEK